MSKIYKYGLEKTNLIIMAVSQKREVVKEMRVLYRNSTLTDFINKRFGQWVHMHLLHFDI